MKKKKLDFLLVKGSVVAKSRMSERRKSRPLSMYGDVR
jgi:hypothetical protein